ncbi:hypothetical protein D9M72_552000 [compost metagenome]
MVVSRHERLATFGALSNDKREATFVFSRIELRGDDLGFGPRSAAAVIGLFSIDAIRNDDDFPDCGVINNSLHELVGVLPLSQVPFVENDVDAGLHKALAKIQNPLLMVRT